MKQSETLEEQGSHSAPVNEAELPEKVAIIHDWLPEVGGAEKVLGEMLRVFPKADLYSLIDFIPESERGFLRGKHVQTTFLQKLPAVRRLYRSYLPLMPLAVEHIDLARYPIVISSSYAVAKGVITGPDQLHLCYCHSPIRYAWDMQEQYLLQSGSADGLRGFLARALLHYVRLWDSRTSNGVDAFATNSRFVARRIWKVYRRRSRVIYPPVEAPPAGLPRGVAAQTSPFYLSLGRLVPYKRVDLIVECFRRSPHLDLVVIGDGPERAALEKSLPKNVSLLGRQSREVVLDHLHRAKALIFAAEEDFGIVPVEAQAMGTPVIAFGKGGACETVLHRKTGVLFMEQTPESLLGALREADEIPFEKEVLAKHASRFSPERFRKDFSAWAIHKWKRFRGGLPRIEEAI
ncbi:MAG: hypothetical protein RLZZ399_1164 [Verrucomicrobiota bacterium]